MTKKVEPSSIVSIASMPLHTRIRDADGFVGTVVYVGSVASSKNSKEQYAGIMWDDISRGKHDGSVVCRETNQVVRHFSCGTTQGSFLKLRKLDVGATLTAALLREKYVKMNAPRIAPNNILSHSVTTSSGREKNYRIHGRVENSETTTAGKYRQNLAPTRRNIQGFKRGRYGRVSAYKRD